MVCDLMWRDVQEAPASKLYDRGAASQQIALADRLRADTVAQRKKIDPWYLISGEDVTPAFDFLEDDFKQIWHLAQE